VVKERPRFTLETGTTTNNNAVHMLWAGGRAAARGHLVTLVVIALAPALGQSPPCSACAAPTSSDESSLLTCRITGDPHYTSWSAERYDFMGSGVFRLARATTACGCDIEVQTMMCPCGSGTGCAPGATANTAVAVRVGGVGGVTLVLTSTEQVTVSGGGYPSQMIPPFGVGSYTWGGLSLAREAGTSSRPRWRVSFPGGGHLVAARQSMSAMPGGAALNVWFALPAEAVAADSSGLCATECPNMLPPLPYPWCSTADEDRCLPLRSDEVLFDPTQTASGANTCGLAAALTRDSTVACVDNSCGAIAYNASFGGGVVIASVTGGQAPADGGPLITDAAMCLDFCARASAAAPYMTFTPPESFISSWDGSVYVEPGACECRAVGVPNAYPVVVPNTARARLCLPQCLADETQRSWINQRRETIVGFEQGIDFVGNDVRRFAGVLSDTDCQKTCGTVDGAVVFTYNRCAAPISLPWNCEARLAAMLFPTTTHSLDHPPIGATDSAFASAPTPADAPAGAASRGSCARVAPCARADVRRTASCPPKLESTAARTRSGCTHLGTDPWPLFEVDASYERACMPRSYVLFVCALRRDGCAAQ
jgi:hypothetical protein